jgi:hypothetical protein
MFVTTHYRNRGSYMATSDIDPPIDPIQMVSINRKQNPNNDIDTHERPSCGEVALLHPSSPLFTLLESSSHSRPVCTSP